jgi:diguanylate cyclase (GGDEF)-like protein
LNTHSSNSRYLPTDALFLVPTNAISVSAAADIVALLSARGDMVFQLDMNGRIMATCASDGEPGTLKNPLGLYLSSLVAKPFAPAVEKVLKSAAISKKVESVEVETNRTGQPGHAKLHVLRSTPPDAGFVAVFSNNASAAAAAEKSRWYLSHDVLTGLPNRMLLAARVRAAIAKGDPFCVVGLNLDEFKKVNSFVGLDAGDKLLRLVSARLTESLAPGDILARTDGKEFVILAPSVQTEGQAQAFGRRIATALKSPFEYLGQNIHLSASIGAALFPLQGSNADTLLAHLGDSVHRAKGQGSGQFVFSTAKEAQSDVTHVGLEAAMFEAVQNGEFHLDYQPLVSAQTGQVQGFEALMRWTRPDGSRVSPLEFIPISERNGLINLLGSWALKVACSDLMTLQTSLGHPAYMSVNVSPIQFRSGQLKAAVRTALELSGLPGNQLLLEITEGALMADPVKSEEILQDLVTLGIKIAIDDFGTGYSSLAYLKKFPVSILKVDRAFVRDLPTSAKDEAICRSVIGMAELLSIQTVAEGVETQVQLDMLKEYGCNTIQGYYTGRPATPEQLNKQFRAATTSPAAE